MPETVEQYRNRMLSNIEGKNPLKVQAATPQKLARLLKGVPKAKLRKRPEPGKWSIHEIVTHMADTEVVYGFRVRLTLGQPGAPLASFDQDQWVTALHYDRRDTATALEQFAALRKATLNMLKTIAPEQWKHFGLHAERGEESVERSVAMIAGHDINHLAQIERILKSTKTR
ncbi:MAG TPA: DinB family protein [Candidatus Acidoferrales bacterium]|nr:DinB family protein [Candidatus Acidoferrales bacterium]